MNEAMDEFTGIDDVPPEQAAWFAAEEISHALEKCAFKSSDKWILMQAQRVLRDKAGN